MVFTITVMNIRDLYLLVLEHSISGESKKEQVGWEKGRLV